MRSFDGGALRRLVYPPHLVSAIRVLGEYKGKEELFTRQTPQLLETLLRAAIIESAESSNRIEGVTAARERVTAIVDANAKPANRSEAEIAGYRDVLNTIHASHDGIVIAARGDERNTALSSSLVRQLHRDLFKYSPSDGGSWKGMDNDIVEHHSDGTTRVRFRPVSPSATPDFMTGLHERFVEEWQRQEIDPFVLIPAYVLDFLCIHPFRDGNGRMARLLTLLLLYKTGVGVGRFISLERIVEESKTGYYEALRASSLGWHDGKHDLVPWVEYVAGMVTAAYREFELRVGAVGSARGAKTEMVRHAITALPEVFRMTDVELRCPTVSREMIRKVLREFRTSGLIRSEGAGKAAIWRKLPSSDGP